MATEMALSLLKRAGFLVILSPAVCVGLCACGTIGEVASRYVNSEFSEDPVIKEEICKVYDRAQAKKNSSGSFFELLSKEDRAAFVREEERYELHSAVEKMGHELEAEVALNIWKQNCWKSMSADFQQRLKYLILNE